MGERLQVHVLLVPFGMTLDQAIDELKVFGRYVDYRWWRWRFRWPFATWYVVHEIVLEDDDG